MQLEGEDMNQLFQKCGGQSALARYGSSVRELREGLLLFFGSSVPYLMLTCQKNGNLKLEPVI